MSCSRCHSTRHPTDSHDAIAAMYAKEQVLFKGRWPDSIEVVDSLKYIGGKPRPCVVRRWKSEEGRVVVGYFFEEGEEADQEERVNAGRAVGEEPTW